MKFNVDEPLKQFDQSLGFVTPPSSKWLILVFLNILNMKIGKVTAQNNNVLR